MLAALKECEPECSNPSVKLRVLTKRRALRYGKNTVAPEAPMFCCCLVLLLLFIYSVREDRVTLSTSSVKLARLLEHQFQRKTYFNPRNGLVNILQR